MHSAWFRSAFVRLLKLLQIKEGGPNFLPLFGPLLYFNFKSFKDPNSLSFIRFHCILHDSVVFFSLLKFLQIKEGGPDST